MPNAGQSMTIPTVSIGNALLGVDGTYSTILKLLTNDDHNAFQQRIFDEYIWIAKEIGKHASRASLFFPIVREIMFDESSHLAAQS